MGCGGQELADKGVIATPTVLEIDQEPVEAGQGAGFGSQGRAEIEKRAERRFGGAKAVAQWPAHPNHL
jgi:hypothetical protein